MVYIPYSGMIWSQPPRITLTHYIYEHIAYYYARYLIAHCRPLLWNRAIHSSSTYLLQTPDLNYLFLSESAMHVVYKPCTLHISTAASSQLVTQKCIDIQKSLGKCFFWSSRPPPAFNFQNNSIFQATLKNQPFKYISWTWTDRLLFVCSMVSLNIMFSLTELRMTSNKRQLKAEKRRLMNFTLFVQNSNFLLSFCNWSSCQITYDKEQYHNLPSVPLP